MNRPVFSVGRVLGRSFLLWAPNAPLFALLLAAIYVPVFWALVELFPDKEHRTVYGYVGLFSSMLSWYLAAAVVTPGIIATSDGPVPSRLRAVLLDGLKGLVVAVPVALVSTVVVGLAFFLLIVPGLYLLVTSWMAVPIAVTEHCGPLAAMRRSGTLGEHRRWHILGLVVIFVLVHWAVFLVTSRLLLDEDESYRRLRGIAFLVVNVVVSVGWSASACALTYHAIRREREGENAADVGQVFD